MQTGKNNLVSVLNELFISFYTILNNVSIININCIASYQRNRKWKLQHLYVSLILTPSQIFEDRKTFGGGNIIASAGA